MNESSRTPFLLQCCLCTLHPVLSLYKRNSRALTSRTARRQCRDCPPLLPCEAVCDQGQLPTVQRAPAPLATTRGRGCYPEKTRQRWQQPPASVRGASYSRAGVAARATTPNQSASLAPDPAALRLGVYFLRTVARRVSNGNGGRCGAVKGRPAASLLHSQGRAGRAGDCTSETSGGARPPWLSTASKSITTRLTLGMYCLRARGGKKKDRQALLASSGAQAGSLRMEGTGPSVE